MSSTAERLKAIQARIAQACARAGREPEAVRLIAVSKKQPSSLIREAYQAGQRDFGENYPQELRDKAQELSDLVDLRWHAIGRLQVNKAKYVTSAAFAFHALDDLRVAEALSARRKGSPLPCYIEVNAGEQTKGGVPAANVGRLLSDARQLPNLSVVGLMVLPPLGGSPEASRPHFAALRKLATEVGLPQLSMGTTADFEVAIEEGATEVRVGTALFGERPARLTSP